MRYTCRRFLGSVNEPCECGGEWVPHGIYMDWYFLILAAKYHCDECGEIVWALRRHGHPWDIEDNLNEHYPGWDAEELTVFLINRAIQQGEWYDYSHLAQHDGKPVRAKPKSDQRTPGAS